MERCSFLGFLAFLLLCECDGEDERARERRKEWIKKNRKEKKE